VRASFGVGTRADDVDRLVFALEDLALNGPAHEYRADEAGRWEPVDDDRGPLV
jgi:hypothetical protein